jgi:serine/threonine-protein kinase 19
MTGLCFQIQLRNSGEIRLFKLGSEANEFCILFTEDYKSHVRKFIENMALNQAVIGMYYYAQLCYNVTFYMDTCINVETLKLHPIVY